MCFLFITFLIILTAIKRQKAGKQGPRDAGDGSRTQADKNDGARGQV